MPPPQCKSTACTDFHLKNATALERLKTEFKGKVEVLQLPVPVLRDLKKLSAEVVQGRIREDPHGPEGARVLHEVPGAGGPLGPRGRRRLPSVRVRVAMPMPRVLLGRGGDASLAARSIGRGAAGSVARFAIGVLNAAWAASHPTVEGLKAGLKELGVEDGRDVTFDIRFTEGKLDAMPAAAAALVKAGVDLIFTSQEAATQAAKDATKQRADRVHPGGRPGGRRHRRHARPTRRQRDGYLEPPDRARGEAPGGSQDARSGPSAGSGSSTTAST